MRSLVFAVSILAATSVFAEEKQLADELVPIAAEAKYLIAQCGQDLDPERFVDLSKIYAYTNGYSPDSEIDWDYVKLESHKLFMQMQQDLPNASGCDNLLEKFADSLPALQTKPELKLEPIVE
ncbi:hypothetical protein [Echinimonas agarilytica]|uniref:Uncharacterized protein n=1 Tax=Echinimonas agarilytica TaxID=1215918 RepID=A0AA42B6H6_9GAMM|nr:hypothetical protein [Echinimonas agarilytica]MCM2678669.1 hypothetical protein [Echinimonas agarilytica]